MLTRPLLDRLLPTTLLLAAATTAHAQVLDLKFLAEDSGSNDFFGQSAAKDGDVLVVGATGWDGGGSNNPGAAYVFTRTDSDGWVQADRLNESSNNNDAFGASVDVEGDFIVVGAPFDASNGQRRGSAWVFERDGDEWVQVDRLLASDGAADDFFGQSVSISGDLILVGAPGDNNNSNTDAGAAYVFRREMDGSWTEEQKLIPADSGALDFAAFTVAIDGEVAVIGCGGDNENGADAGAAYVFRRDSDAMTWDQEAKLLASDGAAGDFFGEVVSLDGDAILVGALLDTDGGTQSGSAYIFRGNTDGDWQEVDKLLPSVGADEDRFGFSVHLDGGLAIVSSRGDMTNTAGGLVFLYQSSVDGTDWSEVTRIDPTQIEDLDQFGYTVRLDGLDAVCGSIFDDDGGNSAGAVYVYDVTNAIVGDLDGDCNENGIPDIAEIISYGLAADCNDNGIPDECDIANGTSQDANGDGVPDECGAGGSGCPGDLDGDGEVTIVDLNIVLFNWGMACDP